MTLRVAERNPTPPGVKVTVILQWPFALRVLPHVVDWVKSLESEPVNVRPLRLRVEARLLVKVSVLPALLVPLDWAAKRHEVSESVTGTMPVPDNVADCGLFEALSVTVTVPLSAPKMLGVNVTEIVQL